MNPSERQVNHLTEAWLLRWLAREPWLTAKQQASLCGIEKETARRHIFSLERAGLVQRVLPTDAELPRDLFYALTNEGLRELARIEGRTAKTTRKRYDARSVVLLRALNRLPFLFQVREYFLCALVARLHGGPQLAVWNWWLHNKPLRKYYATLPGGEPLTRPLACHTYGVYLSAPREEVAAPFFLVWDSGLTRLKAERQRIGAFYAARYGLRGKIAPAQFPSLVIVAASERRETEFVTMVEELSHLRGGWEGVLPAFVTTLDRLKGGHPWAAVWRRPDQPLARVGFLQDAPSLPAVRYLENFGVAQWFNLRWEESLDFKRRKPKWMNALGEDLAQRFAPDGSMEHQAGRSLLDRLTRANLETPSFDKQLLCWIASHRLATVSLLQGFHPRESDAVRQALSRLRRCDLIREIEPPAQWIVQETLFALTLDGIEFCARRANVSVRRYRRLHYVAFPSADAEAPRVKGFWAQMEHHILIAEYMLRFAASARQRRQQRHSKQRLAHWDGRKTMGASFRWRGQMFHFYPDVYALYEIGAQRGAFWLEVDRGSYPLQHQTSNHYAFEDKARAYCAYYSSLGERGRADECPKLLVVTRDGMRARQMRALFRAAASEIGMRAFPPAYVTTDELFRDERCGPLTKIWQRVRSDELVHCFKLLDDLPAGALFSPIVTQAEFDAYTAPMMKQFVAEQMGEES